MTTSKKPKSTRITKSTKSIEQRIYIGPTLSEGRLAFSTVILGGFPPNVQFIVDEHPWFAQLFVPIADTNRAIASTKEKGSYLNILYNKAKKEV